MCYFWFKQVFELKIIQQYRYMMRLDDDSQLQGNFKFTLIPRRENSLSSRVKFFKKKSIFSFR